MAYYIKKGGSPKQDPSKKPSNGRKLFLQLLGGVIVIIIVAVIGIINGLS